MLQCFWTKLLYLMSSMGGAIAVRVAAKRALPTLAGLVVIDVVEVSLKAFVNHFGRCILH